MSGMFRLQHSIVQRILPLANKRYISTSKKARDTIDITNNAEQCKTATTSKNWVSYGFEVKSEADDRQAMHSIFFASVTICLVFGGFYLTYLPKFNLSDWAQREAFIELKRREDAGLPLIDPNLIDPAKISLPTDEELGEQEIII